MITLMRFLSEIVFCFFLLTYFSFAEVITNVVRVSGTVSVSGTPTVAISQSGTDNDVDTELPAAAALSDNTANPTAPAVGAHLLGWDGTTWDRVGVTAVGADIGLNTHIIDATIEQVTAAAHNTLNIAVAGKDAGGLVQPIPITANGVKVDGSAVTQPISIEQTGNNNAVDILTVPADPFGVNADAASATGSISAKLRFIAATGIPITSFPDNEPFNIAQYGGVAVGATNGFHVQPGTSATWDISDAFALDASVDQIEGYLDTVETVLGTIDTDTGNIAASIGVMDDWDNAASDGASVSGDVAHGTTDAGEPVKLGAKVETSPKGIAVATDGQRTNLYADADGILIFKQNTTGADLISERISNTNGTSTVFTNFSAVASTYNYVTAIVVWNSSATDGYVDIRDGTAGSIIYTIPLPAGGGAILPSTGTPYFKSSANTALAYDVSAAITTVYLSMTGFQSKL